MAIQILEKVETGSVVSDNSNHRKRYCVVGATSEQEARAAIFAEGSVIPLTYQGLLLVEVRIEEIGVNWCDVECTWQMGKRESAAGTDPMQGGEGGQQSNDGNSPSGGDPIPPEFSMDTAGETIRVFLSKQTMTMGRQPNNQNVVPDYKGAIGVSGKDGNTTIEGVEVTSGAIVWSEVWVWPRYAVTWAYVKRLRDMADEGGTVNTERFRDQAGGEVRFIGAQIASEGLEKVKVTYNFHSRKNDWEFMFNRGFRDKDGKPILKKGQHYAWCVYGDKVDKNANALTPNAEFVYIERIYNEGDLAKLGIGR